jgi:uncharacterized protein
LRGKIGAVVNKIADDGNTLPGLSKLRTIIRGYASAIVAYSGGVDSTVVLAVAAGELGEKVIGIIGKSPAYPSAELNEAISLARSLQLPIRVMETDEHLDPRYLANDSDRCFFCRSHLFELLVHVASAEGYEHVLDGVHTDDLHDHGGGISAAQRNAVRSPLMEAGLGKDDVRAIAHHLRLPVWNKPAMACLASRIPTGTPVSMPLLSQIERAEEALRALGFVDFRVRHHGELARLEVNPCDLQRALELRRQIVQALRKAGYRHVTMDLQLRRPSPIYSAREATTWMNVYPVTWLSSSAI